MEAGRDSRNVRVAVDVAGAPRGCGTGHLVVARECRIPVDLGFVLAVGCVPHDFGAVGTQVADLHVLDVSRGRRAHEGRERERGRGAVDEPLGGVRFAPDVNRDDLEVVGCAVLEPRQVDLVLYAVDGILRGNVERTGFTGAVEDHGGAAHVLGNLYDGRIVAHVTDFHVNLGGGAVAVFFADGNGARSHEHGRSVDTGFGKVVVFPAERRGRPGVLDAGGHAAEQGARGRVVLVASTRHVLAFGVRSTVVRVGVVLVAHAQQEGNIPGVHAEHVVQLVDAQLFHLCGVPVLHALLRQVDSFQILGHVGIGEHFENVARLVAVVNPGLVSLHVVPQVAERDWGRAVQGRDGDILGTASAQVADVGAENQGDIFGVGQAGLVVDAVLEARFLVAQKHLIEAVERVGVGVRPARILARLPHAVAVPGHPAAMEEPGRGFLRDANLRIFHGVVQVVHLAGLFVGGEVKRNGRNGEVVVRLVVAVVGRARPAVGLRIVHIGLSAVVGSGAKALFLELQVLGEIVHLFGHDKAAVCKGLVVCRVFLAQNGEARRDLARNVGTQFAEADVTFMRTSATGQCRGQRILVFGTSPPSVVGAKVSYGDGHIVDDAICKTVGAQKEVGTVLGFAQNVGNTVGIDGFAHVVGVVVLVAFRA